MLDQLDPEGDVSGDLLVAADGEAGLEDLGIAERAASLGSPERAGKYGRITTAPISMSAW